MVRTPSPALTENTEATVVETTTIRRTETLWAELQEIQQNETAVLQHQRAELEQEKASMNTLAPDASDIVTINVGGEVILQATRDTLCLAAPGSRFAALFSGRWEDHCVKDAKGRIFLDHDPELVRIMVNYMRIKRVEDPASPLDPPTAPETKGQEWFCLLDHYGLTALFTKPSSPYSPLDVSKLTVVQKAIGLPASIQRVGKGLQLSYNGISGYDDDDDDSYGYDHFVACTPCLVPQMQSSWKVTINKLSSGGRVCLGVIGKTNLGGRSYGDSTSYGWAGNSHVYVAGSNKQGAGGWTNFTEGECLLFGLANNKLTMYSVTKSKRFVIDEVPDGEKFIHFHFAYTGTITLEPLDATEYAKLMA
jgi:BTB/POZ domain